MTYRKTDEDKKIGKAERGAYHMDRWLNEPSKEEAWSVYVRSLR
jgi:hypothetical protein